MIAGTVSEGFDGDDEQEVTLTDQQLMTMSIGSKVLNVQPGQSSISFKGTNLIIRSEKYMGFLEFVPPGNVSSLSKPRIVKLQAEVVYGGEVCALMCQSSLVRLT